MSRQFRYRMVALGLSGLIVGAPLLLNGTASAEQVESNERRVSFAGAGMLGLSCGSRPSVEAMTVPAGTVVRVVNQTGHDAQLRLAGTPRATIPSDGAAEVVFRRGATPVSLTPVCASGADPALPLLVTATPSASAADPDRAPESPGRGFSTMSKPARPDSPVRSVMPDSIAPVTGSDRTAGKQARRGVRKATAKRAAGVASRPASRDGVTAKIKTRQSRGTGTDAPAFAGMPPGGRRTSPPATSAPGPVPAAAGVVPPGEVPSGEVPPGGLPAGEVRPGGVPGWAATPAGEPSPLGATEPVAAVGRIEDGHPLGLLGLTALVCVLGVATAAIRAIVSQRASRTNMA